MLALCDRQVGMPSMSLLIAASGIDCYGSTDKSAGCSVAFFYNFFVLFAKGGIISITIFPFFLLLCLRQEE